MSKTPARLVIGVYIIDFDERPDRTYYSISKTGSNDIVSMGQEATYAEAEVTARWTIARLNDYTAPQSA